MNLLELAKESGFEVIDNANFEVDDVAFRILPRDVSGIGISVAGDVLEVLLDHIPTPAEFSEIEKAAGMLITTTITTPDILKELSERFSDESHFVPKIIAPALDEAVRSDASDLHLAVGSPPIIRVGGELVGLKDWGILSNSDLLSASEWVLGERSKILTDNECVDYDGSVTYHGRRWRINLYKQRSSLALSMRLIPSKPPLIENLGLPQSVANLSKLTSGLVLFAGPTGSGKSTSLASLIDRINKERRCHILTIEDPIEYQHQNQRSIIHQREIGHDTESFAKGLRAALRQDPDVILVGELRDIDTMTTALHAAETGHLVLATVHASSVDSTITRLVSSFPGSQQDAILSQLASSLQAIVCQTLLPREDKSSKRALATEVLIVNTPVRAMIRDKRLHEVAAMLDANSQLGMISMEKSLANLVAQGIVRLDVAEMHVDDHKLFLEFINKGGNLQGREFDNFNAFGDLP